MKEKLRHIVMALMLAVILVPMIAPASLLIQKWMVKWEMKEKLEYQDLQWISLHANAVKWHITGKECIIDGRMFDVKEIRENNGSVAVLGIFDDRETEIEKKLSSTELPKDNERSILIYQLVHMAAENIFPATGIIQPCLQKTPMASMYTLPSGQSHRHITTPPPEA